jgi:hypothetical protein
MPKRGHKLDMPKLTWLRRLSKKLQAIWTILMGRSCMYRVSLQVVITPDGFPTLEFYSDGLTMIENRFDLSKKYAYPEDMYETFSG